MRIIQFMYRFRQTRYFFLPNYIRWLWSIRYDLGGTWCTTKTLPISIFLILLSIGVSTPSKKHKILLIAITGSYLLERKTQDSLNIICLSVSFFFQHQNKSHTPPLIDVPSSKNATQNSYSDCLAPWNRWICWTSHSRCNWKTEILKCFLTDF